MDRKSDFLRDHLVVCGTDLKAGEAGALQAAILRHLAGASNAPQASEERSSASRTDGTSSESRE